LIPNFWRAQLLTTVLLPTQAATRLDPRSVQAINMLGLCYTSQGDLQDGITAYEKALRLDPGLKDAWSNLATAHKEVRFCTVIVIASSIPFDGILTALVDLAPACLAVTAAAA
jgi:tetratricopeptide (TPR) repeat protein